MWKQKTARKQFEYLGFPLDMARMGWKFQTTCFYKLLEIKYIVLALFWFIGLIRPTIHFKKTKQNKTKQKKVLPLRAPSGAFIFLWG